MVSELLGFDPFEARQRNNGRYNNVLVKGQGGEIIFYQLSYVKLNQLYCVVNKDKDHT